MAISLSTALSGMSAANERLRASSENLASAAKRPESIEGQDQKQSDTLTREATNATTSVQVEKEIVEQRSATYAFVANLKVLQTQVRAEGALLDIKA